MPQSVNIMIDVTTVILLLNLVMTVLTQCIIGPIYRYDPDGSFLWTPQQAANRWTFRHNAAEGIIR